MPWFTGPYPPGRFQAHRGKAHTLTGVDQGLPLRALVTMGGAVSPFGGGSAHTARLLWANPVALGQTLRNHHPRGQRHSLASDEDDAVLLTAGYGGIAFREASRDADVVRLPP
jgi:hypothetical protein